MAKPRSPARRLGVLLRALTLDRDLQMLALVMVRVEGVAAAAERVALAPGSGACQLLLWMHFGGSPPPRLRLGRLPGTSQCLSR